LSKFEIDELFKEKSVAKSLIKIERPSVLSMTPKELYEKIKEIVVKRYNYTYLPENQNELYCLKNTSNKISLLRDICLKNGLKLLSSPQKDFLLENEYNAVKLHLAQ